MLIFLMSSPLQGHANRQNFRCRLRKNPHWMREEHMQYPANVNVWTGIVGNDIIDPFFINSYLSLLQNNVVYKLTSSSEYDMISARCCTALLLNQCL